MNDHYPFAFNATSRPTTSQVVSFRGLGSDLIDGFLRRTVTTYVDTYGDIKPIEIELVNLFVDNYYARGRGERTHPIRISEEQKLVLRKYKSTSGMFHYGVQVP